MTNKKIMIAVNSAWNLVNFRAGLIRALQSDGYKVVAVAPEDRHSAKLVDMGCSYVPLPMDNKGANPWLDGLLLLNFWRLLRVESPACFLGYTVKPNIYGSLAAHSLGIPVVNNIAGLGTAYMSQGWLNQVVSILYRRSLSRSAKVFFQNNEDLQLFVERGLVSAARAMRLPGSGVDLNYFRPQSLPDSGPVVFLLIARLLWDKGVGEYVEAARRLRARHGSSARFQLLGFAGAENRSAIPETTVRKWVEEGVVDYLGAADDVRPHVAAAHCVVLPSYYKEGVPRSLLEAAAMARPIVTSNTPGCRDAVEDGETGLLCQPRSVEDLVAQLEKFLALSPGQREVMGRRGRAKIEQQFDEQIVISNYAAVLKNILPRSTGPDGSHIRSIQ
jgi:glycosyltransferase involved in cell wall biosynthesis